MTSDVDPDPVGSVFVWARGSESGSKCKKMRGKAEFNQQILGFFCRKLYFLKSETKKGAYLKGLCTDLKIFFFLTFKRWVEIKFSPGSALTKFCGSGSAFDQ